MTTPLVFIDCETTSLRPDRRAWEIAAIRWEDGEVTIQHTWQVDSAELDLGNADPASLRIGGYYEGYDYGERPPMTEGQAAREIEIATRGAHLVGVNPAFDAATLDAMLRRNGYCPAWHYHLIDVPVMALGWLKACSEADSLIPWKSDQLSLLCDVNPGNFDRHAAMGDAQWAMAWFDAIGGFDLVTP